MNCEQVRDLLGKKERADLGFYPTQSNHALQTVEACRRERARQRQTRECTAWERSILPDWRQKGTNAMTSP